MEEDQLSCDATNSYLSSPGGGGDAFAEISALEQDLRIKQNIYAANDSRTTTSFNDTAGVDARSTIVLNQRNSDSRLYHPSAYFGEDERQGLAPMRTSAATSLRGAFSADTADNATGGSSRLKPSQERLERIGSLRHEQKQRLVYQQDENDRPRIGPDNEEEYIDELQIGMNAFIDGVNEEDEKCHSEKIQKRRQRFIIAASLGVILIISVVAIVLRTRVVTSVSESDDAAFAQQCRSSQSEETQPERYHRMRYVIVSQNPAIEFSLAARDGSARKSLCWLVHTDTVLMTPSEGVVSENEYYQLVQRFTLGLVYYHFVDNIPDERQASLLTRSNWLAPVSVCEWDFLSCTEGNFTIEDNIVTKLALTSRKLRGRIPSELSMLAKIRFFDLSNNFLTGQVPSEICTMTHVDFLRLDTNESTGTIPSELVNLSKLTFLALGIDSMTGTFPKFDMLSNLRGLSITQSAVTGAFPNIMRLSNLEILVLRGAMFTGSLAAGIGSLSKLSFLELVSTEISGSLPTELGRLSSLTHLHFKSELNLSGTIPSELGDISSLTSLNLRALPFLSGTIPSELGRLAKLETLDLSYNRFLSGTVPSEICCLVRSKLLLDVESSGAVLCDCCFKGT